MIRSKEKKLLHWDWVLDKLSSFFLLKRTSLLLEKSQFYFDKKELESQLEQTFFIKKIIENPHNNLSSINPFSDLDFFENKFSYNLEEILLIAFFLKEIKLFKKLWLSAFKNEEKSFEKLKSFITLFQNLNDFSDIFNLIFSSLNEDASIKIESFPSLRDLIFEIQNKKKEIQEKISKTFFYKKEYQKILQDLNISIREQRYCISIKRNYINAIDGLVMDYSKSGSTAFFHPQVIRKENNELISLYFEKEKEILKIIQNLNLIILNNKNKIIENKKLLCHIDLLISKARFSLEIKGNLISVNENKNWKIIQATHPLIKEMTQEAYIPLSFSLKNKKALVISGPNTGGKTVTLKSLAFFCLLNQFALLVPMNESSSIPIFKHIRIQLGDDQNVYKNQSSFSAEILGLIENFELFKKNEDVLMLLDEPLSKTDPLEGTSLAIASILFFMKNKSQVLVTSHSQLLLQFFSENKDVVLAALKFDKIHFKPEYTIKIPARGKSHAFEIAEKLAFPKEIIENGKEIFKQIQEKIAKDPLSFHTKYYNQILFVKKKIVKVKKKILSLKKEKQEIENTQKYLEKEKKKFLNDKNLFNRDILLEKRKIIFKYEKKIKSFLNENKKEVSDIEFLKSESKDLEKNLKITNTLIISEKKNSKDYQKSESEFVKDIHFDVNETVLYIPNNKEVQIQKIKNKKIWIIIEDKILLTEKKYLKKIKIKKETKKNHIEHQIYLNESENLNSYKLDIHGLRWAEAEELTLKYIEILYLKKREKGLILHGIGKGILKRMVLETLKKHPYVKCFYTVQNSHGSELPCIEFELLI